MTTTPRVNARQARARIHKLEPFRSHSGHLRGETHTPGDRAEQGRLPGDESVTLEDADYIVYSYATPIGWHVPGHGWVVPRVRYSVITSTKHQPVLAGLA